MYLPSEVIVDETAHGGRRLPRTVARRREEQVQVVRRLPLAHDQRAAGRRVASPACRSVAKAPVSDRSDPAGGDGRHGAAAPSPDGSVRLRALAAGCEAGAALLGEGLDAPLHAANTTIVLASRPKMRVRIKAPPNACVSPHTLVASAVGHAAGLVPSRLPAGHTRWDGHGSARTSARRAVGSCARRYYGQPVGTLSNAPRQPSIAVVRAHLLERQLWMSSPTTWRICAGHWRERSVGQVWDRVVQSAASRPRSDGLRLGSVDSGPARAGGTRRAGKFRRAEAERQDEHHDDREAHREARQRATSRPAGAPAGDPGARAAARRPAPARSPRGRSPGGAAP